MDTRNTGDYSHEQQPAQGQSAPQIYYAPPHVPTKPTKPTVRRRTAILIGIGALILGAGMGAASKNPKTATTNTDTAHTSVTATATLTASVTTTVTKAQAAAAAAPAAAPVKVTVTETAPPPTSAPATGIEEGTYIVGTDIKPGLYKTTGATDSGALSDCYWERDRDLNGSIDSIADNGNTTGQTTVQISSSDKAFKTSGCAPWVKVG